MKKIFIYSSLLSLLFIVFSCEKSNSPVADTFLHSFYFSPEHNPCLQEQLNFEINATTKTVTLFTLNWIENIDSLVAGFSAKGKLFFEGEEQISGITVNNYIERELIYSLETEDEIIDYKIVIESPQTTGLPVINIEVDDRKEIVSKEDYLDADIRIVDSQNPEFNLEDRTEIRGRGNSTWEFPKKPYRLKLNKKASLFGLKPAKSWVLLANYNDPTFLTATVALELGKRLELEYTNHVQDVELYLNGTYRGKYQLTEQVQVDENRVHVDENNGGFLIEMDIAMDEKYSYRTEKYNLPIMIKDPENEETFNSIKELFHNIENTLTTDELKYEEYEKYIDVNSLINYLLLNEIIRNWELYYPKSVYAYRKDRDDKLHFGPIWDFDWGYGYKGENYEYFTSPESRLYKKLNKVDPKTEGKRFFCRFFDDPAFIQVYVERWNEVKSSLSDIPLFIEREAIKQIYSQRENAKLWGTHVSKSYSDLIYDMGNWLTTRMEYLDKDINNH